MPLGSKVAMPRGQFALILIINMRMKYVKQNNTQARLLNGTMLFGHIFFVSSILHHKLPKFGHSECKKLSDLIEYIS